MDTEHGFVAPEGLYSMVEEHKPNILHGVFGPGSGLAQHGTATKVSTVTVNFPVAKTPSSQGFSLRGGSIRAEKKEAHKAKAAAVVSANGSAAPSSLPTVHDNDESVSSSDNGPEERIAPNQAPASGTFPSLANGPQSHGPSSGIIPDSDAAPISPPLFAMGQHHPLSSKKKTIRSKQSLKTTTSSFVTRVHSIEGLGKLLASKVGDVNFIVYNSGKSIYWTEIGSKTKDPLSRITFSAWPTCHAVNNFSASAAGIDVIIGFNTGDVLWFDPITSRYTRLNKQGCITCSPCTAVRWVPRSPNLFLVSHADGTIIVYDRDREDAKFKPTPIPQSPSTSSLSSSTNRASPPSPSQPFVMVDDPSQAPGDGPDVTSSAASSSSSSQPSILPHSTAVSNPAFWDPKEDIWVSRPGTSDTKIEYTTEKERLEKEKELAQALCKNPVSHWKVSHKPIVDFAFSPDIRYIAVIAEDGCLRLIDALSEKLVDSYASYFGAMTSVAWSPDGRFILTGGQDDLVTILSPAEQRVVARCQGHSSFVSSVAFDPSRSDGRTYRFVSVGEDCKIVLWDFSPGALHRPKYLQSTAHRSSISSQHSLALRSRKSDLNLHPNGSSSSVSKFHQAPSRNEVALVQPVLVKSIEGDILSFVAVTETSLVTVGRTGLIKVWSRPPPPPPRAVRPRVRARRADQQQGVQVVG